MVTKTRVEELIDQFKAENKVMEIAVVGRSGTLIAGETPKGAHIETYAAMIAITFGAIETAASETNEGVKAISALLQSSNLIISQAGNNAILIVRADGSTDYRELKDSLEKLSKSVGEVLS
ncbi:MAG: roadblock/LC7 domain-containing protein [Candidatus Thermoplasmatota archaeon]